MQKALITCLGNVWIIIPEFCKCHTPLQADKNTSKSMYLIWSCLTINDPKEVNVGYLIDSITSLKWCSCLITSKLQTPEASSQWIRTAVSAPAITQLVTHRHDGITSFCQSFELIFELNGTAWLPDPSVSTQVNSLSFPRPPIGLINPHADDMGYNGCIRIFTSE